MKDIFDPGRILADVAATSPFEWIAAALGVVYILLIMRRNRLGWLAGGASSLILMVLALRGRLPMQGGLQFVYVLVAIYGWWNWRRPARERAITLWPWPRHLAMVAACALLAFALAPLLRSSGASAWPFLDPFIAGLGVFASWLTAQVKLENWMYWIVIDTVSLVLFTAQGMPVVALLFIVYLGISCIGLVSWSRQRRLQVPVA
jgi:nicotinamide mononucleotide transporter